MSDEESDFVSPVKPPGGYGGPSFWFVFCDRRVLLITEDSAFTVPVMRALDEIGMEPVSEQYLGTLKGRECYCAVVAKNTSAPTGMAFQGLRSVYGRLDEELFNMTLRAVHLLDWDSMHRFCTRCGAKMMMRRDIKAKECPVCGLMDFPRISPAVIVLVEKEGKVLLARERRFNDEFYSVLAGFVEPGETLEDTVKREIREEVGIEVDNIRYFGSQPWPFPDSLMCAFTALYAGGEIKVDGEEVVDARWFDVHDLPAIPGKISIARSLIDWFVDKARETVDE